MPMSHVLPDVLRVGLDVVFVGTAAGDRSAREGAYYAHPGNKFWRTLYAVGLTPRLVAPAEFGEVLAFGIGMTDLCKTQSGRDHAISEWDVPAFERKMRRFAPKLIAFTSKTGASRWSGTPVGRLRYGLQPQRAAFPHVFVLPSPSGAAAGHWTIAPWQELAALVAQLREEARTNSIPNVHKIEGAAEESG
jgi:TDG/mug DNA glycosylase family protein